MTALEVLNSVVRPVLADSLGIPNQRDIWVNCSLKALEADEWVDLLDIAWRLKRQCLDLGLTVSVEAQELRGEKEVTVADLVTLMYRKINRQESSVPLVVDASQSQKLQTM